MGLSDDHGHSWSWVRDLETRDSSVRDTKMPPEYRWPTHRPPFPRRRLQQAVVRERGRGSSIQFHSHGASAGRWMRSDPSIVQTADGAIHVVYTWKKHRLKHVVIDEGWVRHPRCPVVLLKGL